MKVHGLAAALVFVTLAMSGCTGSEDAEDADPQDDLYAYGLGIPGETEWATHTWQPTEEQEALLDAILGEFITAKQCAEPMPEIHWGEAPSVTWNLHCHDPQEADRILAQGADYSDFSRLMAEASEAFLRMTEAIEVLNGSSDQQVSFIVSRTAFSGYGGMSTFNRALNYYDDFNKTADRLSRIGAYDNILYAKTFFINARMFAEAATKVLPQCDTDYSHAFTRLSDLRDEMRIALKDEAFVNHSEAPHIGYIEKTIVADADHILDHNGGIAVHFVRMNLEYERNRYLAYEEETLPTLEEAFAILNQIIRENPESYWIDDFMKNRVDLREPVYYWSPRNAMNALALSRIDYESGVDYCGGGVTDPAVEQP